MVLGFLCVSARQHFTALLIYFFDYLATLSLQKLVAVGYSQRLKSALIIYRILNKYVVIVLNYYWSQ